MVKYSEDHEWVKLEGDVVTVGITDFAQNELGDIVFVELPEPGTAVSAGGDMATVESFKAASSVYAPLSGEVVEINDTLEADPAQVNTDPMGDGWFVKSKLKTQLPSTNFWMKTLTKSSRSSGRACIEEEGHPYCLICKMQIKRSV